MNRPSDVSEGNQTIVPLFLWLSFSCTCWYVLEGGGSEDDAQTLFLNYSVFSVSRLSPCSNPSSSVDSRLFSIISQGLFFPVRTEKCVWDRSLTELSETLGKIAVFKNTKKERKQRKMQSSIFNSHNRPIGFFNDVFSIRWNLFENKNIVFMEFYKYIFK